MKRGLFCIVLTFLVISLSISACGGAGTPATPSTPPTPAAPKEVLKAQWETKWEKLLSAAKQEGKVMLYGPIGPTFREKLTRVFKDNYGIELETVIGRPPEVAQKYLTERAANISLADALLTGQTTTLTMIKPKGVLSSPKPHLILPEILDLSVWPGGVLPFLDKEELALALIATYDQFIVVNTELVKAGEVSAYADLLEPKWKGKITLYDPSLPGKGGTWLGFTLLKSLGREEGEKYLRRLATQDLAITRDMRLHAETIARGKYAIGIGGDAQAVQDMAKAGAPIVWARMKEGGIILPGSFVINLPDKPANPNAAILMINYLLSKEGQLMCSEAAGMPAMRNDVPTTYALAGTVAQPGDKVIRVDEDFILTEPKLYPLAREIFGIR